MLLVITFSHLVLNKFKLHRYAPELGPQFSKAFKHVPNFEHTSHLMEVNWIINLLEVTHILKALDER